MTTYMTRRAALTIVAGGAALATSRSWAQDTSGRVIYPVAVPVYQTQFVADRIGFFKDAGLECKLIQGGSGVKTREIIASSQGDLGIGDITQPMQLSNHGRAGRVRMRRIPSRAQPGGCWANSRCTGILARAIGPAQLKCSNAL